MIRNFNRTAAAIGTVALASVALVACGDDNETQDNANSEAANTSAAPESGAQDAAGAQLTGTTGQLVAEGATSQKNAIEYFSSEYSVAVPGANLAYNATGSGAGVKNFIGNQAAFAGSDSPLKDDEIQPATDRCGGNEPWHLPLVVGPVAIAYNLEGVDELNLTVDNIVSIFKGEIDTWNDPQLAEANPGVELPDEKISVVYRSDESGTSDNFQKFLKAASDGKWESTGKAFPQEVGSGANGSTGVAEEVKNIPGAITYVEAGYAEQSAAIDFGAGPVKLGEDTVQTALDKLEFKTEGHNMVVDSDKLFSSQEANSYPLILTTYEIVCSAGYDEETRDLVKDFLNVALDSQDEELASEGFIPVKGAHAERLREAVNAIQ